MRIHWVNFSVVLSIEYCSTTSYDRISLVLLSLVSSVAVVVIPDNRIWKPQRSKSFGVVDDDEHGKNWLKNQKKKANKAVSAQHAG
jgi:hypothetical protein